MCVCVCICAPLPPKRNYRERRSTDNDYKEKISAATHTHVRAYVHVYICIYIYIKAEGARHAAHTHTCARRGAAIAEGALHASRVQCPMLLALRLLSLSPLQTCPRSHYEHVKQDAHTDLQPTSPLLRCGYALALEDRPSGRRIGALHPAASGGGWPAPGHRPPKPPAPPARHASHPVAESRCIPQDGVGALPGRVWTTQWCSSGCPQRVTHADAS